MSWLNLIFLIWQIIAIIAVIHVIMDNRQPAKTMAWAMVIWFVPVVGFVFYLFFGINTRKERLISERSMNQLTKRSMLEFAEQQNLHLPEPHRPMIDLFINQNLSLPFKDNQVEIYTDGYQFFPALLKAIHEATSHIHIDMYIFADDALGMLVADALLDKARAGVEVRVIYDDVGCWNVSHDFFERMREGGIEVVSFLPVRFPTFTSKANYRNHRKIIVIDGAVGFIGGMNIAKRYVKGRGGMAWRDTMLKVTGGAVYALQRTFLVDWYFVDRTLLSDKKLIDEYKKYSHILTFETKQVHPSTLEVVLKKGMPTWPSHYNDDEGNEITDDNANKTFGIKYMTDGIFEAFSSSDYYTKMTININK